MGIRAGSGRGEGRRGQASVEAVALTLLVALALGAALLLVPASERSGVLLARAIGERLVCAASLGTLACKAEDSTLAAQYGGEVAELLRKHAPKLMFERGATNLPVDFRECREESCAEGRPRGRVLRSRAGRRAVLFTRAIDCREGARRDDGADCSGGRAGSIYLQYWAYFPTSDTWGDDRLSSRAIKAVGRRVTGDDPGFHLDDWESLQLRIRPDGAVDARASSHHGYNHRHGSPLNWLTDVGRRPRPGWGPATGRYYLTWGSNAGGVEGPERSDPGRYWRRQSPGRRILLRPLEPVASGPYADEPFAVTPPWRKAVWSDPEATGT